MLILEHLLLGLKVLLMNVIEDIPSDIQEELSRQQIEKEKDDFQRRVKTIMDEQHATAFKSLVTVAAESKFLLIFLSC
jgi:hypothetical protein